MSPSTSRDDRAPVGGAAGRRADWRTWQIGRRVVVRRHLAEGGYSDVVGELLTVGPQGVRIATRRHGEVDVPATDIAIGRVID